MTPGQIARLVKDQPIRVELRRDWVVTPVSVRKDGWFVAEMPAGEWRLEYLGVGERAEFFRPHVLEVKPQGTTCVGTLTLVLDDVETELGANVGSEMEVEGGCGSLPKALRRKVAAAALVDLAARPAEPAFAYQRDLELLDFLLAVRAAASVQFNRQLAWSVSIHVPLNRPLDQEGAFWVMAGAGQISDGDGAWQPRVRAGAGFVLLDFLEVSAGVDLDLAAERLDGHTGLWAGLRFGGVGYGLGFALRADTGAGVTGALSLDLAPFFLLGMFL